MMSRFPEFYPNAVPWRALWPVFCVCMLLIGAGDGRAAVTDHWRSYASTAGPEPDHGAWSELLQRYLVTDSETGVHLFRYANVSAADRAALTDYLQRLQAVQPAQLTRPQQMAYWINLYNALTVNLILTEYPIESIRQLGQGLFSRGPWDDDVATVAGSTLTLNDIEHRILRPIWQDPRIHYAVNCASIGCPNLAAEAWTAERLESMLEESARAYINHPRGVSWQDGDLLLSSIYKWYSEDFGDSVQSLLRHLQQYAEPPLARRLETFDGDMDHDYDWRLNDASAGD